MIDLGGRRILVTGGSRGIGRATALLAARAGADVGITYRSRVDQAEAVTAAIRALGRRAWHGGGDHTDPAVAEGLVAGAVQGLGGLDGLVVNHGIWPTPDIPLVEMSDAHWRETLAVNLDALFYLTRAALRHLGDGGRIVLVSSTAGQRGEAFHADYAASKGAVISMTKSLAVECAPRLTVNAVAPGWVDTEMAAEALEGGARAQVEAAMPLQRIPPPEDIAGPIVFLLSDLARHVNGEILNVNGGSVLCG